jgi:hypothetical protein
MERQKKIEKSRDGVPIWDGDAATFQEYEEASLLWEQGIASHKRYLSAGGRTHGHRPTICLGKKA